MKKRRYSEAQIFLLKEVESGVSVVKGSWQLDFIHYA